MFLMVMQTSDSSSGRCGRKLQERGYPLALCYPQAGQPLPRTLEHYAGVIVFGGSMSANDEDTLPGIRAQLDWIPHVLAAGVPFLGICLGAQLLARVLGATVRPHPEGWAEMGYYSVEPTPAGQGLFTAPLYVYHWHREGFELPAGTEWLARGTTFPYQAYRYGPRVFGFQFHPEVDGVILDRWLAEGEEELTSPGAQAAAVQRAYYARYNAALDCWVDHFLDYWLSTLPPQITPNASGT